jgi:beta-glucosidase
MQEADPTHRTKSKWRLTASRAIATLTAGALLAAGMAGAAAAAAPGDDAGSVSELSSSRYPFQDPSLEPNDRVRDLVSRMTLDEKVGLLHQFSAAVTRLGVPQFRTGTEGLHGLSWLGYATVFPQSSGIGMTWNPDLAEEIGNVVGRETRAYNSVDARFNGVNVWAPVVDTAHDPRYGRI